jgi:hypothetical protein
MNAVRLNPRSKTTERALALSADAGQWLKLTKTDGRKCYGIPSQSEPGRYYVVTPWPFDCQCAQFRRAPHLPCKHVQACRIHVALVLALSEGTDPEAAVILVA